MKRTRDYLTRSRFKELRKDKLFEVLKLGSISKGNCVIVLVFTAGRFTSYGIMQDQDGKDSCPLPLREMKPFHFLPSTPQQELILAARRDIDNFARSRAFDCHHDVVHFCLEEFAQANIAQHFGTRNIFFECHVIGRKGFFKALEEVYKTQNPTNYLEMTPCQFTNGLNHFDFGDTTTCFEFLTKKTKSIEIERNEGGEAGFFTTLWKWMASLGEEIPD